MINKRRKNESFTYKTGKSESFAVINGTIIVRCQVTIVIGKVMQTVKLSVSWNKILELLATIPLLYVAR